jgi:hypothetical protein
MQAMLLSCIALLSCTCAGALVPTTAPRRDSKLIFQSQLSLLQNAAAGAPPPQDSFPHARSTSRFGEILWRANDAARARNALDTLGSDPLTRAQTLGDGVLAALQSQELVERRQSARRDLLTPKRSPDLEGVLLWECADAISKAAPALACDDHVGVLYALALARAALSARGHGADARRLERAVAKHFHALPRETKGDVAYDLVAADDIRRSPRWDGNDEHRARAKTVLVAFAGLGSRGHVGYEWRGAAHRVSQNREFDVLFAADPAASWYTGGACWRYRGDAALRRVLRGLRNRYDRVAFVGDSMGGSAALRYASYADAVCALAPQVTNLAEDPHVGREDLCAAAARRHVEGPLLRSVERALRRRIPISVHFCAGHARDAAHVAALPPGVTPVPHAGDAHDVAALLKADGVLDDVVRGLLVD